MFLCLVSLSTYVHPRASVLHTKSNLNNGRFCLPINVHFCEYTVNF